jgi:hypothetical protein
MRVTDTNLTTPIVRIPDVSASWKKILAAAFVAILAWAAWDLFAPRSHSLRSFQPEQVGRLETAMWRSYYAHDRVLLFRQLATLLRTQYDLPLLRSYWVAYRAARAAAIFQPGHTRQDYEKALPDLVTFYDQIRRTSREAFDSSRAARLELEWWIVHRERQSHSRDDLVRSLAALQAELYHLPEESFLRHARLRADAMLLRDRSAEGNTSPTEPMWHEIDRMLCDSWRVLWEAVNAQQRTARSPFAPPAPETRHALRSARQGGRYL